MKIFYITLLIWNTTVMLIYAADKILARKKKRRIKESTLILTSFFLGGAGAIFGMVIFNHKTSKMKFRLLIPIAILVNTTIILWINSLI